MDIAKNALKRVLMGFCFLASGLAAADEIWIDFGAATAPVPAGWVDGRVLLRPGTLSNMKTSTGAATPYSIVAIDGFSWSHTAGAASPLPAGFPAGAATDGMIATMLPYGGRSFQYGSRMTIRGLNPSVAYSFEFYGKFGTKTPNRNTRYLIQGATNYSASLDVTGSVGRAAYIPGIKPKADGTMGFVVSDAGGNTDPARMYAINSMKIKYTLPSTPPPTTNYPPTVSAGPSRQVTLPTTTTTLNGSASDANGIASVKWTRKSGDTSVAIASSGTVTTGISNLKAGSYVFTLTATDKTGKVASSDVSVTVSSTTTTYKACSSHPSLVSALKVCAKGTRPGVEYGFLEYLPSNYATGSNFPLVIFLHGIVERGDGSANSVVRIRNFGPMGRVTNGWSFPFIAIAPQEASSSAHWNLANLDALVEHLKKAYKVDPARIHLTGLSFGGGGTLDYATTYPSKLASIAPVASGYWQKKSTGAAGIFNAGVSVWLTHADNDCVASPNTAAYPFLESYAAAARLPSIVSSFRSISPKSQKMTAYYDRTLRKWAWNKSMDNRMAGVQPDDAIHASLYTGLTCDLANNKPYAHNAWFLYDDPAKYYYNWLMLQRR